MLEQFSSLNPIDESVESMMETSQVGRLEKQLKSWIVIP
jgi:hypothetical protein